MRPTLTAEMAKTVVEDRVAAAERFRQQEEARRAAEQPDGYEAVTVRLARDADCPSVRGLARREGSRDLQWPVLVAEAEGALVAARSLADGRSVADPLRHTAHLSELLALRAAHLQVDGIAAKRRGITGRLALALRFVHS